MKSTKNNELYASGPAIMNSRTSIRNAPPKLSQLDEIFCYKRYFVFFVGLVFLSLPFSEWRIFHYDLLKSQRLSFSDLLFLISGIAMLAIIVWKERISIFANQLSSLWPLILPLLLMVIFFSDDTKVTQSSISIYMILGANLYMVLSTGILLHLGSKKILSYLTLYTLITIILLIPAYLLTRFSQWDLFMYGEATPSLHFPFDSPNQAALFCVVLGVLTVGVLLSSKKFLWLYLVIPVAVLAAFQTGSRTGALFSIVSGLAFLLLFLIKRVFFKVRQLPETVHFLFSSFLGVILLFFTRTPQNMRGLDVFRYNVMDMLSGNVDSYRFEAWKNAFNALGGNTIFGKNAFDGSLQDSVEESLQAAKLGGNTIFGKNAFDGSLQDSVEESLQAANLGGNTIFGKNAFDGSLQDSVEESLQAANLGAGLHNIYLDLWVNWGVASLLAFLVFLAVLFVWTTKMLWLHRRSDHTHLYGSLLIGLGAIAASLYANPLLHLKFIWVYFGLIAALHLWSKIEDKKITPIEESAHA